MINIQLILDKQVIREFTFPAKTPFVTIGRRPHHDICLDNLAVSSDHARLIFDACHVTIVDMNSSNGTLLNGMMINRPTAMNPGDTIQIGKYILQVGDKRCGTADVSPKEPITIAIPHLQAKMNKTGVFSYDDINGKNNDP